jgi:molybdopterin/thiamine biosynthesis adenylyltransferase
VNDQQLLRYSRHILLDEIGIEGQERLLASHALIVGAGGLGSPVAYYLASAGVGKITLVDNDTVDLTNLQRQILHTTDRVGMSKARSGQMTLAQINPEVHVVALQERVSDARLHELVATAQLVLDCTDNFATRHAINRACVAHKVPLVSGGAIMFDGQISVYDKRHADSPCYSCLFPENEQFPEMHCSIMGVFAPLVGIIGASQATEAIKLLAQVGTSLEGRLLMLNARTMAWSSITLSRNPACPVCGQSNTSSQ